MVARATTQWKILRNFHVAKGLLTKLFPAKVAHTLSSVCGVLFLQKERTLGNLNQTLKQQSEATHKLGGHQMTVKHWREIYGSHITLLCPVAFPVHLSQDTQRPLPKDRGLPKYSQS